MHRNKKVGILTFHYSINEGAILQAQALLETCRRLFRGCEVEIVRYEVRRVRRRDLRSCFEADRSPASVLAYLSRHRRLRAFQKAVFGGGARLVSDDYREARSFIDSQGYDALIVGSDEVWKYKPRSGAERDLPNPYWLTSSQPVLRCSYAASANKLDLAALSESQRSFVVDSLGSYDRLSVRDRQTQEVVEGLIGPQAELVRVVDPTLLDPELRPTGVRERLAAKGFDFERPTALLNTWSRSLARMAIERLRGQGWQTVCVTHRHPGVDLDLVGSLDPLEWADLYRYCHFAFTGRFHGAVMAVKSRTPFVAIQRLGSGRSPHSVKVLQFLEDLGLDGNVLRVPPKGLDPAEVAAKIDACSSGTDFDEPMKRLEEQRATSLAFLERIAQDLRA